ncbi:TonB-dependent receptor [Rhodobacteraceae bacterium D3-12]|nr:TonB-dependent receptor [Rhodobacteraceae bacterium D3-12]
MKRSALARFAATTAITAFITTPLYADEVINLDAIIISGGLTPIEAARYGRAASVLSREEIEQRGITSVQNALRALPGVSVNGAGNSFTQVRIRGGEANHTLILIDGVEAAGGDSDYILSGLETANIERIEVLRGPQSVYYGSNASAGVINIITRQGTQTGQTYSGKLEFGAATTASAFVSTRNARGGLSLALSYTDDKGYDLSGDGGEKDSIERRTAILKGDYALGENLTLGFNLRRSRENYDADSTAWLATDAASYVVDDPTQFSQRDEFTSSVFAEYAMLDGRLVHRLQLENTDNRQTYNGGAATKTRTQAAKYRLSYGLDGRAVADADHLLNAMLEWEKDSSSSNPAYGREAMSYALEYRGSFNNGLDLQAGVRFDDNKVFDDAVTWTLGMSYTFEQSGIRLHASAGAGVVNPTYFELYANAFGYSGNPNLTPERNQSFDIGVEVPVMQGRGSIDLTYFNEALTDEITSVSTGPGTFSYVNQTGESKRHGLELSGKVQATDTLAFRLSYTYLEATNPDGSVEVRRPQHELALGATLQTFNGRGSISADIRHVAGNYDTQFWGSYSTVALPAYTTVDLAAQYQIDDRWTVTGRVTNLFDKDSSDVWGYANRGRAIYVGLGASF